MAAQAASISPGPALPLNYRVPESAKRRTPRWIHAVFLTLLLPAGIVPFVDFTHSVSPLAAVWEVSRMLLQGLRDEILFGLLAAPFFAGIVILIWQLRSLISLPCTRPERIFAAWTAGVSILMTLSFCGYGLWQMFHQGFDREGATFESIGLGVPLLGLAFLWLARRFGADGDELATIAMNTAYLANAIRGLVAFEDSRDPGWHLTLWCSIVMTLQILAILWLRLRLLKSE